jgi:dTDP-L-rhamnose 4-epimerase
LVALSSRAVYGNGRHACPEHGVVFGEACCERSVPVASTEVDDHRPVSVYGETKSLGEQELSGPAATVPVTVVRPQNVIGPGQALHNPYTGVLAAFLVMLRSGRPVTVYGDGTQTRDFVHVDDLSRLLSWTLSNPPAPGSALVLNSGSGIRTSLLELAQHAIAGRPPTATGTVSIEHLDVQRAGDIDHACADLTRLQELGAPPPSWSTADAVADFIAYSWDRPGADASAWAEALDELADRGLTS